MLPARPEEHSAIEIVYQLLEVPSVLKFDVASIQRCLIAYQDAVRTSST